MRDGAILGQLVVTRHTILAPLRWVVLVAPCAGCGFGTAAVTSATGSDSGSTGPTAPVVSLDASAFAVLTDQRLGIPIGFEVDDPNGNDVELVFQWRRDGDVFPELPSTPAAIRQDLADPRRRLELQIASEYRGSASTGRPVAVAPGDRKLRLPELAESSTTRTALVGRTLSILRAPEAFLDPTTDWQAGAVTLASPVAAVPLDDGRAAAVLDTTPGGWRVRKVDLATGRSEGPIVTGSGSPSAMALEPDGASLLVASFGASWRVQRVRFDPPQVAAFATDAGTTDTGHIRSIVSLGEETALVTVGSSLVLLDHTAGSTTRATVLLSALAEPRGIARDPSDPGRVFVAESAWIGADTTGRVLEVTLATGAVITIPAIDDAVPSPEPLGLPRPGALALEMNGTRLVVMTDANPSDGTVELRGVALRGASRGTTFTIADGIPLSGADPVAGLSTGPDRLRTLVTATPTSLRVTGGLEQTREIVEHDTLRDVVTVSPAFAPRLDAAHVGPRQWRLAGLPARFATGSGPRRDLFVWDSRDVPGGGAVALRATPIDNQIGTASQTGPTRTILDPLDVEPLQLTPAQRTVRSLAAGDLDGDGDIDLVGVGHQLAMTGESDFGALLFYLRGPTGALGDVGAPSFVVGNTSTVRMPQALAVDDLDGDGLEDIVLANGNPTTGFPPGNFLAIYYQDPVDGFEAHGPAGDRILGSALNTFDPVDVAIVDLNQDQRPDLVTANRLGNDLSVFYQRGDGSFGTGQSDLKLGASPVTRFPLTVAAGDLDRNGSPDLVTASFLDSTVSVFLQGTSAPGSVPGVFDSPIQLGGDGVTDFPTDVAIGDVDGDGLPDVVCAHHFDTGAGLLARVSVFLQKPTGELGVPGVGLRGPDEFLEGTCSPSETHLEVELADLDGNGTLDILTRTETAIGVFSRPRHDLPWSSAACLQPSAASVPTVFAKLPVVVHDLDGDGDRDLGMAHAGGAMVFLQQQATVHAAPPDLSLGASVPGGSGRALVASGDLDGDGDLDILACRDADDRLRGFAQVIPGQFAATTILGSPLTTIDPRSLEIVDIDRDGRDDVLVALGSDDVAIFLQTTPGVFGPGGDSSQPNLRLVTGMGASSELHAVAADLIDVPGAADDGLLDIVVSDRGAGKIHVYHQLAPGSFGPEPPTAVLPRFSLDGSVIGPPSRVRVADLLDLPGTADDGLLDLVVTVPDQDRIAILAQVGPSSFGVGGDGITPHVVLGGPSVTPGVDQIVVTDLDANGLLDILCGPDLALFLQSSPGVFGAAGNPADPDLLLEAKTTSIAVADLDADQDSDVLVTTAGAILSFLQRGPGQVGAPSGPSPAMSLPDNLIPSSDGVSVHSIDLDGDGDMDVVAVRRSGVLTEVFFGAK